MKPTVKEKKKRSPGSLSPKSKHLNAPFFIFIYLFIFHEYAIISPKIGMLNCRNMSLPCGWYFYKCAIFCTDTLSPKFKLLKARFIYLFFMNTLLFRRKSAKSVPDCRSMSFPCGWYFHKWAICLHIYSVILPKICEIRD